MIKKFILINFLFILTNLGFAQQSEFKSFYFKTHAPDYIERVLIYQVGLPVKYVFNSQVVDRTKLLNGKIRADKPIAANKILKITVEKDISGYRELGVEEIVKHFIKREKEHKAAARAIASTPIIQSESIVSPDTKLPALKSKMGMFYSTSQGSLSHNSQGNTVSADLSQNSPVTIGFNYSRELDEKSTFRSSLYVSQLNSAIETSQAQTISIPPEFGFNLAYEWKSDSSLSYFIGQDIERLISLDLVTYEQLDTVKFNAHLIQFLSIGASYNFEMLSKQWFLRTSLSQSLLGSYSNDITYSGQKAIAHLTVLLNPKWSMHAFAKTHLLENNKQQDLTITRYGFGLGYSF